MWGFDIDWRLKTFEITKGYIQYYSKTQPDQNFSNNALLQHVQCSNIEENHDGLIHHTFAAKSKGAECILHKALRKWWWYDVKYVYVLQVSKIPYVYVLFWWKGKKPGERSQCICAFCRIILYVFDKNFIIVQLLKKYILYLLQGITGALTFRKMESEIFTSTLETDLNPSYVASSPDSYKQSSDSDEAYDSLRQSSELHGSLFEHDRKLKDATVHLYCGEDLDQGIGDDGDGDAFHNFYQNGSNNLNNTAHGLKYINLDLTSKHDEEANNQRSMFETDFSEDQAPSMRPAENNDVKRQSYVYHPEELQNLLSSSNQCPAAMTDTDSLDDNSRPQESPSSSNSCSPYIERMPPYVLQSQLPMTSQCATPTDSPVKDTKYKGKTVLEWMTQTSPCDDGLNDIPKHLNSAEQSAKA